MKDADGKTEMVHYQTSGDYIILATVPYSDIYHMRNVVVGWIVVGGAVLTADYAEKIGADFYAKDAMETVAVAKEIVG